ncbi:MAG TPA: hypothetical protein VM778_03385 [Gemmatimonadota bacterium]|nr:hypothetical protein [Gemmatimonadota bacterium]
MHRIRILTLAIALGACSSASGPVASDPVVLLGTWILVHSFSVFGEPIATCPGEMTVHAQSGGSFSGDMSILAGNECAGVAGIGTVMGTVGGSSIAFSLEGVGLDDLLAFAGCQPVSASGFAGSASESALVAVNTQTFTCLDPDTGTQIPVQIRWQIEGEKAAG